MKYTSLSTTSEILREFPDFEPVWKKHLEYWEGDDARTIGIDIAEFQSFISDKLKSKKEYDYQKVFDLIEELLVHGDDDIEYAIEFNFFENLLNRSSTGHFPIESFFCYLGKESKAFCKANEEFWGIENSKFYEDK
jgi:hypothetical protein